MRASFASASGVRRTQDPRAPMMNQGIFRRRCEVPLIDGRTDRGLSASVPGMSKDPVVTDSDLYRVVMENDRVRVLEYQDHPGVRTTPHQHPDSVMVTLSSFRRRLAHGDRTADVELESGAVRWLSAQEHRGENIGDTPTHSIFVELKEPPAADPGEGRALGPAGT